MNGSVIVWDLETVPDIGGFAAANDLVPERAEPHHGASRKALRHDW
jgi:hypothetical protein